MSILFLITARGGSKRVPGKNLREISGMSLVAFKAASARKSRHCESVVISTDSTEIKAHAEALGIAAPFVRPAELASDTASSDDVILHALDYFENEQGRTYDAVMLLEPSTPFTRAEDYDAAIDIYRNTGAALVVGMKRTEVHSIFTGPIGPDGNAADIVRKFAGDASPRTQDLEPEYTMNGGLYLIDCAALTSTRRIYGVPERTYGHVMDRRHSVEIDDLEDLRYAEYLIETNAIDLKDWQ